MAKKDKKEYDVIYDKNEKYSQEDIEKLIKIYKMADEAGDQATVQDAFTKIYYFIEKYIYKVLWDNYRQIVGSWEHREDVVQEVWLKIFTEIKNYNPEKGAITTFVYPWIKHVVAEYASKNFRKTSVYYAQNMKKVNGAQNYCRQYGLNPDDLDTLMSLTGLPEMTIKNTLDLISRKDSVSYEALVDAGADYMSQIKGPEETVMEIESAKELCALLEDVFDDEELMILSFLLNPENVAKDHSSYREIVDKIPGSNIPKIKRKVSRMTAKLKNNKKFAELYPYIVAQEKVLENNYIPVLEDVQNVDEELKGIEEFMEDGEQEKKQVRVVGKRKDMAQSA